MRSFRTFRDQVPSILCLLSPWVLSLASQPAMFPPKTLGFQLLKRKMEKIDARDNKEFGPQTLRKLSVSYSAYTLFYFLSEIPEMVLEPGKKNIFLKTQDYNKLLISSKISN